MSKYYENLGDMIPDKLIAGNDIPIHTASGIIKNGSGKLTRGTVLAMSSGTAGTGKLVILGTTAAENETLTAYGILCDDADATSADAVAEIYVSGQFNKGALVVKSGYTINTADIKALRDGGIYVESIVD
ncbi:MAG: head decoration protein [Clostridiales bacterium]|nr:head decoration protein [Clostridiales bacterium]